MGTGSWIQRKLGLVRPSPSGELPGALVEGFARALSELVRGWKREGDEIRGPRGIVVRLAQLPDHSDSPRHVDVGCRGFASPEREIWDCVNGFGETPADIGYAAGCLWGQTTGAVLLELLLSGRGRFASHFRGGDRGGFGHWHGIVGAAVPMGDSNSADALQQWWLDHPLPPALAPALLKNLEAADGPHGVKILFGGTPDNWVAGVTLNGEPQEAAVEALGALPWPRLAPPAFLRTYALLLHPE